MDELFVRYNANPDGKSVGDCTVRAISAALGQSWEQTYTGICLQGYIMRDMPSANHVWGAYLRSKGFCRQALPDFYKDCYTVKEFCRDNPEGTFVLACSEHVVTVIDGKYYDTWNSGDKVPLYCWERRA